ncbi:MarR family winged helix-turn-helix transcriptional regulator [Leucobacter sp. W1153]|uniref:MarR family winged helix-turn-helix transcriptional regulator n=1 Tax=Leucobacter sp. W1153 TaxID=3439064 RepID=UPI003F377671
MAQAVGNVAQSETQWLDPVEREMWMSLVGLTILLPGAVEAQLKRDAGISFFEYHVLAMLSEAENRTRLMSDLAHWANSSLSRLSHVVTRLEKQGWVRREACPTDGRATNAVLTDEGFRHLAAHAPAHVTEVRRLVFDQLSESDVASIAAGLGRILEGIDPDRRRAAN